MAGLVVVVLTAVLGCGIRSTAVTGKITLDGQPLVGSGVTFKAADSPTGRLDGMFIGVTNAQGQYSLRPAGPKGGALAPGKYVVTITTTYVEGGVPEDKQPPPERVPAKYRKGIDFEVPAGGTADANFDLTSK